MVKSRRVSYSPGFTGNLELDEDSDDDKNYSPGFTGNLELCEDSDDDKKPAARSKHSIIDLTCSSDDSFLLSDDENDDNKRVPSASRKKPPPDLLECIDLTLGDEEADGTLLPSSGLTGLRLPSTKRKKRRANNTQSQKQTGQQSKAHHGTANVSGNADPGGNAEDQNPLVAVSVAARPNAATSTGGVSYSHDLAGRKAFVENKLKLLGLTIRKDYAGKGRRCDARFLFQNSTQLDIANMMPTTSGALEKVKGVGPYIAEVYGGTILDIITQAQAQFSSPSAGGTGGRTHLVSAQKVFWTEDETRHLFYAFKSDRRHWKDISDRGLVFDKTGAQLKDKWRTIIKHHHPGPEKVSDVAERDARDKMVLDLYFPPHLRGTIDEARFKQLPVRQQRSSR
jgi:hypothetical protein